MFNVVDIFNTPRYKYNYERKKLLPDTAPKSLFGCAADKARITKDRYWLIMQRTQRHDLFTPPVPGAISQSSKFVLQTVQQLAGLGNALAVHDVDLNLPEGRRQFVFDDLDTGLVANDLVAVLDRADPADVQTLRSVEFQGVTARGRLGRTEHDADFHPYSSSRHYPTNITNICRTITMRSCVVTYKFL